MISDRGLYFIHRSKEVHGDRYDYGQVVYENARSKVTIACPLHGPFTQTPDTHLSGSGCPKCALLARSSKKRLSLSAFVSRCRELFGNQYDYSSVNYQGLRRKVAIRCPLHGEFSMTPGTHLKGRYCPQCTGRALVETSEFIRRAEAVHFGRYDYSLTNCKHNRQPIKIICPEHGVFEQSPRSHLQGRGCVQCASVHRGLGRRSSTKEFIARSLEVHGDIYDYSLVEYTKNYRPVQIICSESGHGIFEQTPGNHLMGRGCPACSKTGFDGTKPAVLYFISINDGQAYKIGITNRNISDRFSVEDRKKITAAEVWKFEIGAQARKWEAQILSRYAHHKYRGEPLLSNGNSELFSKDILGIDGYRAELDGMHTKGVWDDPQQMSFLP